MDVKKKNESDCYWACMTRRVAQREERDSQDLVHPFSSCEKGSAEKGSADEDEQTRDQLIKDRQSCDNKAGPFTIAGMVESDKRARALTLPPPVHALRHVL
jgi:hypothetical protein